MTTAQAAADWRWVADLDEFRDDRPVGCSVDDLEIAVVRHEGEWFALLDRCSHGHVMLSEGDVSRGRIECHLHGSEFDLRTGKPCNLPATQPVPVYPVRVNGESIEVDIANPSFEADF